MIYRGYTIDPAHNYPSMVKVAVEGQGGKIPNVLTGVFTSPTDAIRVIDMYLDHMKGAVNGKATAKGRD